MSDSFVFLHGGFIFIKLIADITKNLATVTITMLFFNMSFETGRMNELETEPTLGLAARI